jgi:hypothetical protein
MPFGPRVLRSANRTIRILVINEWLILNGRIISLVKNSYNRKIALPVFGDSHPHTYFVTTSRTLKDSAVVYRIVRFGLDQRHRRAALYTRLG